MRKNLQIRENLRTFAADLTKHYELVRKPIFRNRYRPLDLCAVSGDRLRYIPQSQPEDQRYNAGHNVDFDQHIVGAELYRLNMDYGALMDKPCICTMRSSTDFCAIPNPNSNFGGYKWPSLQELYRKLFDRSFENAHDALADISATKDCFFELKRRGVI